MLKKSNFGFAMCLAQIYEDVGINEFKRKELHVKIPFGTFGRMREEKLLEVTEKHGQVKTWRIAPDGIKLVRWYKDDDIS